MAASLILQPGFTLNAASAGMLSPHGRCRTFDREADGMVRGEGVGSLHLLRGSAHREASFEVWGSAVRQDGRSASLTAPNGTAQHRLITETHGRAQITADQVGAVLAHGTGTPLGDPTEASAVASACGSSESAPALQMCSLKAGFGHQEPGRESLELREGFDRVGAALRVLDHELGF